MKALIIEATADGLLDLALRAKAAGHECKYHCGSFDPVKAPIGKGLVERVADWRSAMRWCDICIVGGNGKWLSELERWREQGVPIIGGVVDAARLELDRLAGMAAFKRLGVPVAPFRQCSRIEEAMEYVAKRGEGCAVKPCGDVANKSLSFVAKTAKEALWRLDAWRREGKRFPSGFIVQDRIQGIEFAVGGWIGPAGFAPGWQENFEEKKLFAGGLGPNCGEAGTVIRLVKASKLAKKVLEPFEDYLVRLGYVGNIDVNCIIDDEGTAWPLEFTVRLGWPAFNIELALHDGDPVEWLAGLGVGKPTVTRRYNDVAVGVVVALPPYPFGHERPEEVVGVPVWGVEGDSYHHVMVAEGRVPAIVDGRQAKAPGLVTAGSYVMVVTGTGETVQAARGKAYKALDRIHIPASPFWRIDIGQRLRRQLPELQAHSYATGLDYA